MNCGRAYQEKQWTVLEGSLCVTLVTCIFGKSVTLWVSQDFCLNLTQNTCTWLYSQIWPLLSLCQDTNLISPVFKLLHQSFPMKSANQSILVCLCTVASANKLGAPRKCPITIIVSFFVWSIFMLNSNEVQSGWRISKLDNLTIKFLLQKICSLRGCQGRWIFSSEK